MEPGDGRCLGCLGRLGCLLGRGCLGGEARVFLGGRGCVFGCGGGFGGVVGRWWRCGRCCGRCLCRRCRWCRSSGGRLLLVRSEGSFLAASFSYGTTTGHHAQREHREDHQHHQLADEQAPEQAVSGELGGGRPRPGGCEVLGSGGQFAQGERGPGERHAVRPGAVGEEPGEAGGRPGDQGGGEEEAQEADQQAVRDAAAALGPVVVAVVMGGTVAPAPWCLACHVMPPLTLTPRSSVVGARSGPPVAPPPVRRRGCPRGAGRPRPGPTPRSWRGR